MLFLCPGISVGRELEEVNGRYSVMISDAVLTKYPEVVGSSPARGANNFMGGFCMDYEFVHVRGHVEVFKNGEFVLSADTLAEAERELEECE